MAGAEKLYTPELLGLAVSLADFPFDESMPHLGAARSRSCGSTLDAAFLLDGEGRIEKLGLRVRACAVGQAAAAIFAQGASGASPSELETAHDAIAAWLGQGGDLPEWPGIEALREARGFSGRHGAIMLPWSAAVDALSSSSSPR